MRLSRVFAALIASIAVIAIPAFASPDKSAASYKKAATFYHHMKSSNKNVSRKEMERTLGMFKSIYTKNPRGSKTPEALYMSGLLHEELFRKFKKAVDRDNAITIYRVLVRSYPNNSLSDDALYNSGGLRMMEGKDLEALADFRGVLRWFPKGDSAPKARDMIAKLEKEVKSQGKLEKITVARQEEPDFKGVRHFGNDKYARVVFDVSRNIHYRIERSADGKEITVDLLGVENAAAPKMTRPQNSLVSAIQVSPLNNEIHRAMISLKATGTYSTMELSNPQRIVVDINIEKPSGTALATPAPEIAPAHEEAATPPAPQEQKPGPKPEAKPPVKPAETATKPDTQRTASLPMPPAPGVPVIEPLAGAAAVAALATPSFPSPAIKGKGAPDAGPLEKEIEPVSFTPAPVMHGIKTIVIDPGHGGKDPGAIGKKGLKEKDVVLDIGLRLRKQLLKDCNCRVLMTRSADVFIPLEERTAFANTMDADLFISIHVNSNKARSARGVETYFLSPARSRGESYVAARENMIAMNAENQDTNDLAFILFDMQNTDKINESSRMAGTIQHTLVRELAPEYNVKSNGVKQAMFYVLHGAKMPSILVETSFISNAKEEKLLRSAAYKEEIAKGIARGVMNYSKDTKLAFLAD